MSYCEMCGRELDDGEICRCSENREKPKKKKKKLRLNMKNVRIFLFGCLCLLVIIFSVVAANRYKSPMKNIVKGMNRKDVEIIMENIYPDSVISEKRKAVESTSATWKDYLKEKNSLLKDSFESENLSRTKCKFIGKEKADNVNSKKIKDYYEEKYNVKVKKVYRVQAEFSFKPKGFGSEPKKFVEWVYVINIRGEGWKFCPAGYNTINLSYITTAVNAAQ